MQARWTEDSGAHVVYGGGVELRIGTLHELDRFEFNVTGRIEDRLHDHMTFDADPPQLRRVFELGCGH